MYRLMTVSSATDIYYLLAVHLIFRFSQRIILDFLCPVHILAILEHVCDERPILFWKHYSTLSLLLLSSQRVFLFMFPMPLDMSSNPAILVPSPQLPYRWIALHCSSMALSHNCAWTQPFGLLVLEPQADRCLPGPEGLCQQCKHSPPKRMAMTTAPAGRRGPSLSA